MGSLRRLARLRSGLVVTPASVFVGSALGSTAAGVGYVEVRVAATWLSLWTVAALVAVLLVAIAWGLGGVLLRRHRRSGDD